MKRVGITIVDIANIDRRIIVLIGEIDYLLGLCIVGNFPQVTKGIQREIKVREQEIIKLEKRLGIHHEE